MSKGTFQTPRSLGTVLEIRAGRFRVSPSETGFDISGEMIEGEEIASVFTEMLRKDFNLQTDALLPADQNVLDAFIKLMIREYVSQEGYSGVVIT